MYPSCEQIHRPDLRHKAVAVASNGDGLVVALNRAARELGVKRYEPVHSQRHLFSEDKCTLFSSNYRLYQDCSLRLMRCLKSKGIFIDMADYSIDETFGELPHFIRTYDDLLSAARALRRAAWDEVRLPIGVGGGRTFTIAKVSSHIGKKVEGYRGICITLPETESDHLKLVSTSDIWNVGASTAALLRRKGIMTALDLKNVSPSDARSWMGINLERTVRELRGQAIYSMSSFPDCNTRKEVTSSLTLSVKATTTIELHQALSQRVATAAEKLRRLGFSAKVITLYASSSRFDPDPQYSNTTITLEQPTDDTRVFIAELSKHLNQLFKKGVEFNKVGCRLMSLVPSANLQGDLFAPKQSPELMKVVDGLNQRFGSHLISIGAQKVASEAQMLRRHLSPNYTTSWNDLPKITC
ncbi:DUF4113 domain-containing protein [Vibrio agarivorans]|nr:DUF4113 domain-containing protein [Vibrio agarivorans]MDN3661153.1 DUF4113 domain-containing protein [Vibrio agarivorans]